MPHIDTGRVLHHLSSALFSVTINQSKEWSIVPGLEISDYARKMLDITGEVRPLNF
jgi:hypothetical protein